MEKHKNVRIHTWPTLFWPCLWLFLIWTTLDSIKVELRAIRKGFDFPSEAVMLLDIIGEPNEP